MHTGTMPGPAEILQGARNGKVLLPARSRSPIKTSLGSSPRRTPRRSVGPLSSPSQPASKSTPTRAASNPPQKRSLEYSREETTLSTQVAASKGLGSRLKQATKVSVNGRSIKKAFDLSLVDDDDDDDDDDNNIYDIEDENDLSVTNGAIETNGDIGGSSPLFLNGNDPMLASTGEDFPAMKSSQLLDDSTDGRKASVVAKGASETVAGPKKRRGRPSKEFSIQKNPSIDLDDEQNSATKPKAIRGKAKKEKSKVHLDDPQVDSSREVEQEIAQEVEPEIDQEIAQEIVRETAHDIDAVPPPRKKRKAPKAKIVSRDPNSKMKRLRSKGKARLEQPAADKMLLGISKTQSTYNQRYETPADINTRRTRAGRIIVEPVAFWRGERIIYGDANLDGSTLTLPGIKEIVRNDEVEVSRPHKRSGARKAVAKSKVLKQEEEEDEEEEEEEESERELWETETGVVRAQVMQWDPMTGKYDEENTEEMGTSFSLILLLQGWQSLR